MADHSLSEAVEALELALDRERVRIEDAEARITELEGALALKHDALVAANGRITELRNRLCRSREKGK